MLTMSLASAWRRDGGSPVSYFGGKLRRFVEEPYGLLIHSILRYGFQICDMVAIARHLNVTLIVPELDKTSFWADPRYCDRDLFSRGDTSRSL